VLRESGPKGGGSFAAAFLRKHSSTNYLRFWELISISHFRLCLTVAIPATAAHCSAYLILFPARGPLH